MIKGVQSMFYSSKAEELAKFLQEKLEFSAVDNMDGCLILNVNEAKLVSHPIDMQRGFYSGVNHVSFYCDNIEETVNNLKEKGVVFKNEIQDHGYGYVTYFQAPGDFYIQLYEPKG